MQKSRLSGKSKGRTQAEVGLKPSRHPHPHPYLACRGFLERQVWGRPRWRPSPARAGFGGTVWLQHPTNRN